MTWTRRHLLQPSRALCGPALHSGGASRLVFEPGRPGTGITLVSRAGTLDARLEHAVPAARKTQLVAGKIRFDTVEHALSALYGLGIEDARVHIEDSRAHCEAENGSRHVVEPPGLDGSAAPMVDVLLRASQHSATPREPRFVARALCELADGDAFCSLAPYDGLHIDCSIEFPAPIGGQRLCLDLDTTETYISQLAAARTFGFAAEAERLHGQGLALGASLSSALVFDDRRVLNHDGSRFHDEPVRHKVLDAVGDIALLGGFLSARVRLHRASHRLLQAALRPALQAL